MDIKPPKSKDWLNSKVLEAIVKAVQSTKMPTTKRSEFRVSSLPFCPLLAIIEHKDTKQKYEDYDSNFYFSIGHALHFLFQKFARDAKNVTLIGDWKCHKVLSTKYESNPPSESATRCTHKYELCSFKRVQKNHTCPHKLSSCTPSNFEYEEITLLYDGISGHIDLIFKIDGKYHLVDIKTTSTYLFDYSNRALESNNYPNIKYWHQIETYSILIEKLKGVKIESYSVLYVARDRTSSRRKGHMLFVRKLTDKMRKSRMHLLNSQIQWNKKAQTFIKSPAKSKLDKIWKDRPCQTKQDYMNIMDAKFYGNEKCPYYKDGSCLNGKIKKRTMDLYNED